MTTDNDTHTITLDEYIERHQLSAEFDQLLNGRTDGADADYDPRARHYRVTVFQAFEDGSGRRDTGFSCEYSMGSGNTHDPVLAEVLACLAMDFSGYFQATSFEDWAENYGYDPD